MSDKEKFVSISPMKRSDFDQKKMLILAAETSMSRQLALRVIDKPLPRVWMIFIPIIFVMYFWKLKEYENALKEFSEHHLLSWSRTLEAAFVASKSGISADVSKLVDQVGYQQEKTRIVYAKWLTLLIEHYQLLFTGNGDSYPELVRAAYQNKSNYMIFCHRIGKTEATFNMVLLETIDGDSTDLCQVTKTMIEGMRDLRFQEAEKIFW